ncbi:MAG: sulfite exporter TauE/SafE family protein [Gemmatimonadetes bacterium]|nr:sulfite exporter TauE/SafE family protein [Gemmatimonadota bacterium]NNK61890.1 sulfite exporter TauE/SafE family protein [Gemmatimonadota bacterium]
MTALGSLLGVLVGLSLGMLGGGGSVLTVPIFVYVLGFEAKVAIAGSLAVVGAVSLVGAGRHARAGNVEARTALVFAPLAMGGAFAGARTATLLADWIQLVLFATVMLAAAGLMLRPRGPSRLARERPPAAPWLVGMAAVGVGVLTGLVGVGGGFLIVPALVLLLQVPIKRAVGTSLLIIAFNAAAGFAGYLGQVTLPVPLLVGFGAAAVAGVLVGAQLAAHVPSRMLRRGFAVFLIVVAVWMLAQNL